MNLSNEIIEVDLNSTEKTCYVCLYLDPSKIQIMILIIIIIIQVLIDNDIFNEEIDENQQSYLFSELVSYEKVIYKEVCKRIGINKIRKLKKEKEKYDSIIKSNKNDDIERIYKEILASIEDKIDKMYKTEFDKRIKAIRSLIDVENCKNNEIAEMRNEMNKHILSLFKSDKDKKISELQEDLNKERMLRKQLEDEKEKLQNELECERRIIEKKDEEIQILKEQIANLKFVINNEELQQLFYF